MERANIITEWHDLSGEEQLRFCRACVIKVADKEFGVRELFTGGYEIDDYAHEVYRKLADETLKPEHVAAVNANRIRTGKAPITLRSMVYNTARAVLSSKIRAYRNRAAREAGALDTISEWRVATPDCADEIISRVDLEAFKASRDETDRRILELVALEFTERQIAKEIGDISNVAVHKRIVRMRNALIEAVA